MCTVTALIGFQVASGALGYLDASDKARVARRQQGRDVQALGEASRAQQTGLAVQERQTQEELARERMAAVREGRRTRASAIIGQIERGQAGASASRAIDDILRQEANVDEAFTRREDSITQSFKAQQEGLIAQTISQGNQILSPIQGPNLLSAVVGTAGAVVQTKVAERQANKKAAGV